MAPRIVTALCHHGGRIQDGPDGVEYSGGNQPAVLRVDIDITFHDLQQKLYGVLGWDKDQVDLEIIGKLLVSLKPYQFVQIPIVDDSSTSAMFDQVRAGHLLCIDLFLSNRSVSNLGVGGNSSPRDQDANLNALPTIPGQESSQVLKGASSNNDTDIDTDEDEQVSGDADSDVDYDPNLDQKGVNINNSPSQNHLDPPAPEFEDVSWLDNAVSRDWELAHPPNHRRGDLYVGQTFQNKVAVANAVKKWHIKHSVQFKVVNSGTTLLCVKCKEMPQCKWKLRASHRKQTGRWVISRMGQPHTCRDLVTLCDHKQLDSNFVAAHIFEKVKSDIELNITAIQSMIQEDFKYKISYRKAWFAKRKCITRLFGSWEDSYKVLPMFMEAMQSSNPGTIVQWITEPGRDGTLVFQRVFWAFHPSIEGFKHCRPLISVDSSHLYGKYKGKLLVAVAFDANNGLFPLSFAIVDQETNETWEWFIACIAQFVSHRAELCILSDQHIDIKHAVRKWWPEPHGYHRYCSRHFLNNLRELFKDDTVRQMVNQLVYETQPRKFDRMLDRVSALMDGNVRNWLDQEPVSFWSLAYDGGRRYGQMTTNVSELFNTVLKGARYLPITALVQLTFYRVNKYFATRREQVEFHKTAGALLPPAIALKLQGIAENSKGHRVAIIDHRPGFFEVTCNQDDGCNGKSQVVDMNAGLCTCNKWQIYRLPCAHLMAVCEHHKIDYTQFVDRFYFLTSYESSYAALFHPVPDQSTWPEMQGSTLIPDERLKQNKKGRPKTTSLRNHMGAIERHKHIQKNTQCGLCGEKGHNRRSCGQRERNVISGPSG